jgi:molecular chaperone HtpG
MDNNTTETYDFQAEIPQLMNIIIKHFYSNKDVFLRELISNSNDALDKLRYESLSKSLGFSDFDIKIVPDIENKTLSIIDNGIGMTKNDLINNLGRIAKSGTKSFFESLDKELAKKENINMIGQFGVGFYSGFLVADKITVFSRHYTSDEAYSWESVSGDKFVIEKLEGENDVGTTVILHLRDDDFEYLQEYNLKRIITKYSNFVNYPIKLYVTRQVEKKVEKEKSDDKVEEKEEGGVLESKVEDVSDDKVEEEEGGVSSDANVDEGGCCHHEDDNHGKEVIVEEISEFEEINCSKPLWIRNKSELTFEDYNSFFKNFTNSYYDCLTYTHFKTEANNEFSGLFFIPSQGKNDIFSEGPKEDNIKLYVKRVFITSNTEILPKYLSFINGIVDSNELELNASRELLQTGKIMQGIIKQCTKKCIEMMENIPEDKYPFFYNNFHKNIKLGVYEDDKNRDKLSELLRFYTLKSNSQPITSLKMYISNMLENQKAIYYISGESIKVASTNPILEKVKNKGYDVLLLADPIDEYCIQKLTSYDGKDIICVTKDNFKIEDDEITEDSQTEYKPFCEFITKQLNLYNSDINVDVSVTNKLVNSPCTITTNSWGMSSNMERIIKSQAMGTGNPFLSQNKKKLEINPKSKLIEKIKNKFDSDPETNVSSTIGLLYESALLSSGYSIDNPNELAERIQESLTTSL